MDFQPRRTSKPEARMSDKADLHRRARSRSMPPLRNSLHQRTHVRDDVAAWMAAAIKPGPFSPPGLAVSINGDFAACGVDAAGVPVTAESRWPLACLTKLALADAAVQMLDLDCPINVWLPKIRWPFTVRELLTHTSGLPLDLPNHEYGLLSARDVRDRMMAVEPVQPAGAMAYSNIGYGWIALALERVTGSSLTVILSSYNLTWGDELEDPVIISDVRSPFAGTPIEPVNSRYWRSLHLPWCGAFGTIATVRQLLDCAHPLMRASRISAPGGFPPGAFFGFLPNGGSIWDNAEWSCGVEFRGTKKPHWVTPTASPDSFGHVGSSGILAWKDGTTTIVIAGPRTTDGGWMLRHGPKGTALALHHNITRPVVDQTALTSARQN